MALFSRSKKPTEPKKGKEKKIAPETVSSPKSSSVHSAVLAGVLIGPRITEKATDVASRNVFVFDVSPDATKERVAAAIKEAYKVTPMKIGIVVSKQKRVFSSRRRGTAGFTKGGKKAYVYLKEGDKIEFA